MLEKLSTIINEYIDMNEITDFEEFSFTYRLIEIFEKYYKHNNYELPKNIVPFEKSYKYVYNFLKSINPEYACKLEKLKEDDQVELLVQNRDEEESEFIDRFKETTDLELFNGDSLTAYTVNISGENKIIMSPQNTLTDAYILTHEFIHTLSLSQEESVAASIFCEALTFLAELLQSQYFKDNNIKEHYKNKNELLSVIYDHVEDLKIKLQLINICLNKHVITVDDLKVLITNDKGEGKTVLGVIENIIDEEGISTLDDERYIIGIIFAYYMFDRIKNNNQNIKEFIELNEMIKYYIPEEFVIYLDLEYIEESDIFKLTEESYKKLEKSFVKVLKDSN